MPESKDKMKIVVSENGPYIVTGSVPLSVQVITPNKEGFSWDWVEGKTKFLAQETFKLCRCGQSGTKPFCDGTHTKVKFNGKETASRVPYARQAEFSEGDSLILSDAENLCAFARFCDPGGKIWSVVEEKDPKSRELAIREANHCSSGRLVVYDKKTQKPIEHPLEPSIGIVEDPALGCSGPLWIRGGITVESHDGVRYEKRNRMTLCRCGVSVNKPFCNGSHASIKFDDGLKEN